MNDIKEHDFAKLHPNLAKQWHPTKNGDLKPTDVTPGSHHKVWWKCEQEHEWQATVSSRTSGNGCPYCANQKVCADNNLASKNPNLTNEWHPTKNVDLKPTDVTPGSHQKVWWKCNNGHEWVTTINSRTQGTGCPLCART